MDANATADRVPDAPSRSGSADPVPEQAPLEPAAASEPEPQEDVNPVDSPKDETPAHINRSPTPKDKDTEVPDAPPAPAPAAPSSEASAEAPHSPDPTSVPAVPPVFHLPLTMVQTTADAGQNLTARQLGQRARRARERELQAQGLYTPKRRTSSSATMPDMSHAQVQTQDTTMQSADEGGDDDGEGELESDVAATPSVPPHSAAHLIPPIAVLAPVTTPSRASLAQRARRERERATRLGVSPTASPDGTMAYPPSPPQPIPFNPTQTGQPLTLTRGQLAQRARRARERVERAAKAATANGIPPGDNWTPSLNSATDGSGGMSSAGEAVFAVAPPPPGFTAQVGQTSPQAGYGVGLGAAHVPQQLNRAQLAQRARRARERQQRLAAAATHASGVPMSPKDLRSDTSSVPPASPTRNDSPARTSLSPMASSTTDTPAPLNIASAQFTQVFQSLTAGDNGVSRAVADSGAGVLTAGGRTSSPTEKISSAPVSKAAPAEPTEPVEPVVEPAVEAGPEPAPEPMEVDQEADQDVDQLSEETPAPAPTAPLRPPTPPIQTASPNPQPEVHRSAIQSVGA